MSENNTSWFHCGRCGSLFLSPAGDGEDRVCGSCGRKPSLGLESPIHEPTPARDSVDGPVTVPSRRSEDREKHSARKRRRSYFIAKLMMGWLLVLIAIVFGARRLWREDTESPKNLVSQAPAAAPLAAEDIGLLEAATPLCSATFSGFLAAGTPEERNQFVLTPITTAARMARFYSLNPLVNIDPRTISLNQSSVIQLPGNRAIETQWSLADGRLLDAVFFEENGEWRLDWDHYARFSDYPWALFLAGSEKDHGEFRLLARERLADERKDGDDISIVLYAPLFGQANETGYQSPEFRITPDSRNGQMLNAAFKLAREGKRVFGVRLPSINPEGMIRVRVKVRRKEQDMERSFELEEVVACHWYSVDDPGVEVQEPAEK